MKVSKCSISGVAGTSRRTRSTARAVANLEARRSFRASFRCVTRAVGTPARRKPTVFGPTKQAGRIGIDRLDFPSVDIVADLNQGLPFLPDHSVDEIHSKSLFEHVDRLDAFLKEICRVLKPGGRNFCFVPHFSNPYYYSDYTHTKSFGLYTFYYFVEEAHQLRRKVPNFYTEVRLRVLSQKLVFQSTFRGMNFLKKVTECLVNQNSWLQEFYEENLCYWIPCYGIEVVFEPA